MFLSIMAAAYCEETLEGGDSRVVLRLPAALAPVKVAVMPLVRKDGLPEKAREIIDNLRFDFKCQYDEKDPIGKRYHAKIKHAHCLCTWYRPSTLRRQHGQPYVSGDSMEQQRYRPASKYGEQVSLKTLLKKIVE